MQNITMLKYTEYVIVSKVAVALNFVGCNNRVKPLIKKIQN